MKCAPPKGENAMEIEKIMEANKKLLLLRRGLLHHMLMESGLHPGQPELLFYVQQHPGCSQRQMADDAGVTAASIASSFKRMENAGLIRRRSDTADLRCNRVYITQRGEEALRECMEKLHALNDRMMRGLDAQERQSFCLCLEKVMNNLLEENNHTGIDKENAKR